MSEPRSEASVKRATPKEDATIEAAMYCPGDQVNHDCFVLGYLRALKRAGLIKRDYKRRWIWVKK